MRPCASEQLPVLLVVVTPKRVVLVAAYVCADPLLANVRAACTSAVAWCALQPLPSQCSAPRRLSLRCPAPSACMCPHSRVGPVHPGLAFLLVVHRHAVRAGLSARQSTRSRGQVADESRRVFVTTGVLDLLLPVRPAMTAPCNCMREPHMSDTMATSCLATTLAVRMPAPLAWPLSFDSEPWSLPLRLARPGVISAHGARV